MVLALGGKQYDGNVLGDTVRFQLTAHFPAVHLRHYHVGNDHVGNLPHRGLQSVRPVMLTNYPVIDQKLGFQIK